MASTARAGTSRGRKARSSRSPRWWRAIKIAFAIFSVATLTGTIVGFVYMLGLQKEAAAKIVNIADLVKGAPPKPSVIYAADGTELYETIPERRHPVSLREVPEFVQNAILAAEDRRFRQRESAVDIQSLGRAVMRSAGGSSQGGSTLPMQLAKLLYSNSERTIKRKLQDVAIAGELEHNYTKDQILEMYLNIAYFGEGATGIDAAARTYFGKSVGDLSYAEAAMLARCVRRPSDQNPVRNYAKALENGHVVLGLMHEEGWATDVKYEAAMKTRPKIQSRAKRSIAPIKKAGYFVSNVLADLKDRGIDISGGGYTVHTTIDLQLQGRAEQEVRDVVANHRSDLVNTAAFLLMDRDGHVLAMVGGMDYRKHKYNLVTMGGLQPGSSFKPIVYATALEKGVITEDSDISNAPIHISQGRRRAPWTPHNSGRWGASSYPLAVAFANSINLPAIHTIQDVTPSEVVKYATERFGYEVGPRKPMMAVPSLALGTCQVTPMEMASAYSVFMTGGTRVKPYSIERVIGPDGAIVLQGGPTRFENVIKPETCATIDRLMEAVVQRGTGKAAQEIEGARGKTGTTNDAKDAWFCGYAQGLVGIGWIGNERNGRRYAMRDGVYGGTVTVEMWRGVMRGAVAKFGTRFATGSSAPERPRRRAREDAAQDATNAPLITTHDETTTDDDTNAPVIDDTPTPPVETPTPAPEVTPPTTEPAPVETPEPKRTEPKRTKPRVAPHNDEESVTVEICADSGARATPYCPETVTRTYAKGKAPRGRCPIHRGNG